MAPQYFFIFFLPRFSAGVEGIGILPLLLGIIHRLIRLLKQLGRIGNL